jgi:2-amino-4-hydroxy-6-hydroxymethyldihydropteridine diphosphokinase
VTQRAYVALGSNLGDPLATVQAAFAALRDLPQTRLAAASSLYRSAPVGLKNQPDFINAVAALDTRLDAEALLDALFAIEARFGRRRDYHHAPRTLDLDLLLYGDETRATPRLVLPHPRMHGACAPPASRWPCSPATTRLSPPYAMPSAPTYCWSAIRSAMCCRATTPRCRSPSTTWPTTPACVARGLRNVEGRAFLIADMPFGSYQESREQAMRSAVKLLTAGAQMVKLEGGAHMVETVRFLVERGVPVCAHLGLTPQSVHQLGGYRAQGVTTESAEQLKVDAPCSTTRALDAGDGNGARALAAEVTAARRFITIGIGAASTATARCWCCMTCSVFSRAGGRASCATSCRVRTCRTR